MKPILKCVVAASFVFFLWGAPQTADAGLPTVQDLFVTDVTTVSFSVIWAASEASTASLVVFEDAAGNIPVTSATIIPHPVNNGDAAIRTAAENNGVMKVMVTGLTYDTTYYFRTLTTSKSTTETAIYPAADLLDVTTEVQTVRTYESNGDILPFSNDIIIEPCYLADGVTPATGTLLMATVAGANHPLTAFVGDGVDSPNALIDLNNAFSRNSFENIDVIQGKNLTLLNFRGIEGNAIINERTPLDNSMCEIKNGDFALKAGRNMVSFQLEPGNTNITDVLNPIMNELISVWAYDNTQNKWVFFVKDGLPFLNELNDIHSSTGYWIYTSADTSCTVNGSFNEGLIALKTGRNVVGFKSVETLPLIDAVDNIYSQLVSIWHFDQFQNKWVFFVKDGLPS